MVKILKFSLIFLFTLAIVGSTDISVCRAETYEEETRNFSRAKILSVNLSDSTIEIVRYLRVDRKYYTLKVLDTTVIKKDNKKLKLSDLKAEYIVSITYTKDKDGNKIATSISVSESK